MTLGTLSAPHRRARAGRLAAVAAMVGSAACWGGATVLSKGLLDLLAPFTLLAAQLTGSVLFLWLATLVGRPPAVPGALLRRAALTGLLEPGLSYGLGVPGLALTSAASAAVIGAAEPAFVCLFAVAILKDRLSPRLLLALAAASAGVLLVTLSGGDASGRSLAGDMLLAAGTAVAALYVIASSRFAAEVPPLLLAACQQSVGLAVALLLLAGALALGTEPAVLPGPTVLVMAMLSGVVQYAFAFWLYLKGLQVLPAARAGLYLALIPVFGVAGAVVFLGERPTIAQLAGCAIVVAAVLAITGAGAEIRRADAA